MKISTFLIVFTFLGGVVFLVYVYVKQQADQNAALAQASTALQLQQFRNDSDPTGGWVNVINSGAFPAAINNIKSIFQ